MKNKLYKMGITEELAAGYIGLIFFMFGATIESSWFSSFLVTQGLTVQQVSGAFTGYGILVAGFSWLTSFLVNRFTAKKIMACSVGLLLLTTGVLVIGIVQKNALVILTAYPLRGICYPLFSYAFLVMVTVQTDLDKLGKATSWFWLCFNLGMSIIGPILSVQLLKILPTVHVLLLGAFLAIIGGSIVLLFSKESVNKKDTTIIAEMKTGLKIMWNYPVLFIGMIVKAINNIGQFGFVIMMPLFLVKHGYSLVQWSTIWSICYSVNSFAGLFFGSLGDRFGWRRVVVYFSGTITGLACLLISIVTTFFSGNYFLLAGAFCVFAVGIAAFGPLSALIPALVPNEKTTAISVLNLGSGLSNFIGPFLVTMMYQTYGGNSVLLFFAGLYFLASFLAIWLRPKEKAHH